MNWLGILFAVAGIFYLINSIMNRDKPTIYFGKVEIVKGKEEEYYKLQLYLSILNSFILIITGTMAAIYKLDTFYVIITLVIIYMINSMIKMISKIKGYVKS